MLADNLFGTLFILMVLYFFFWPVLLVVECLFAYLKRWWEIINWDKVQAKRRREFEKNRNKRK